jgi:hypothetical protein
LVLTVRGWELEDRFPVKVALGLETQDEFLNRAISVYPAFKFLNAQGESNAKVISVGNEYLMYTQVHIYSTFTNAEADSLLHEDLPPDQLSQKIRAGDFDYLLVNWEMVRHFNLWDYNVFQPGFLDSYARLVYARADQVSLYQFLSESELFSEGGDALSSAVNLLNNPGFEELDSSGMPVGWEVYNQPIADDNDGQVHSGQFALRSDGEENFLYQEVPVNSGHLYTFGMWVRSDVDAQLARQQIMWRDENLATVLLSFEPVYTDRTWRWVEMSVSAPEGARSARIYVTSHTGFVTWMDDVCFAAGPECPK